MPEGSRVQDLHRRTPLTAHPLSAETLQAARDAFPRGAPAPWQAPPAINRLAGIQYPFWRPHRTGHRTLRTLNLSADPERKLLRAEAVTWARMSENEVLRTLLAAAYEAKRHFLPFTVVH